MIWRLSVADNASSPKPSGSLAIVMHRSGENGCFGYITFIFVSVVEMVSFLFSWYAQRDSSLHQVSASAQYKIPGTGEGLL
jgi:hypothetical protein